MLAIIGVLSVGGIAGYSKAMQKYKLNKQAEQITTIITAIDRHYDKFDNNITDTLIKMGEIPEEMIQKGSTDLIYDTWGNQIYFGCQDDNKEFYDVKL